MVPYNSAMRHCLVLYVGMVDLLVYWCLGLETLHRCFCIPWHWEADFLAFTIPIKHESNIFFTLPIFFYLVLLFYYTCGVIYMFFSVVFYSKVVISGWNILPSVFVSRNPGWFYFVNIRVLIIALLEIVVTRVPHMAIHTFLLLFLSMHNYLLLIFRWCHIIWWNLMENFWVSDGCIFIVLSVYWDKSFWYIKSWFFSYSLNYSAC